MNSATAVLILRNDMAELVRLNGFVSDFCERNQLPAGFDMALNLAAEETFVNVIMHGFDDQSAHEIGVTLAVEGSAVVLTLEDDGRPFNPLGVPEFDPSTPLEQRRVGGLGIHLLRSLMSELRYEHVGGKNRLILFKHLDPAVSGETL